MHATNGFPYLLLVSEGRLLHNIHVERRKLNVRAVDVRNVGNIIQISRFGTQHHQSLVHVGTVLQVNRSEHLGARTPVSLTEVSIRGNIALQTIAETGLKSEQQMLDIRVQQRMTSWNCWCLHDERSSW